VSAVSVHLEHRRILTTRIELSEPFYQGISVVARVRGAGGTQQAVLRDKLVTTLYRYINPLVGGPEGTGWPWGRELNVVEVSSVLLSVEGVVEVDVRLYLVDLLTGEQREGRQRVRISPDAVMASFRHQVLVQ
jgi:hypothetical protein